MSTVASIRCSDCRKPFRTMKAIMDHRRDAHGDRPAVDMQRAVPPVCDYCNTMSHLAAGDVVYPHRPDLAMKRFYLCAPCDAWVGCHPGTLKPLGRLANAELRRAKQDAHAAFDPLWRAKMERNGLKKFEARNSAYAWLASELGIPKDDCHIGMFDTSICAQVVEICSPFRQKVAA